jgi:hypothetical protein
MMEAETTSETLDCNSILTPLIAREDFIAFSRRESFKSYIFEKTDNILFQVQLNKESYYTDPKLN